MSRFSQTMFSQVGRARTLVAFAHQHLSLLNAIGLLLVVTMTIGYIIQINRSVTQGYQIRDLETRIHELSLANQQIEVQARQAQSLERVNRSVKMLGLVESDQPTYISAGEPSYALAN